MKFKAKKIFADYDEDGILIISLSSNLNDLDESIYFIIQDLEKYDSQDKQLNMETYYIEKNDQSMSCYGGIRELILGKNQIQIEFDQKGIKYLKETKIEIELECNNNEYDNLQHKLNKVFRKGELKTTYHTL